MFLWKLFLSNDKEGFNGDRHLDGVGVSLIVFELKIPNGPNLSEACRI